MAAAQRKMKALIFFQTFPLYPEGIARDPSKKKATCANKLGRKYDVDATHLKSFFERLNILNTIGIDCRMKQDLSFNGVLEEIKQQVTPFSDYDYCMLAFLTFSGGGNYLQFNSEKLADVLHSIPELLNFVDGIPSIHDKPKIFLIQADDLSLLEPKVAFKAGGSDAEDRESPFSCNNSLIVLSTIPQKIAQDKSFLVRTFVEAFEANRGQRDAASVMEDVKASVGQLVGQSHHERKGDMPGILVVDNLDNPIIF